MRILLVSQMYPGPHAPDLGTFVQALERQLASRGHEIERAVLDRRGQRGRYARLLRATEAASRRFRPDVVYAHFLVPTGLWAVLAGRAPVVVTAHGQDVENARNRNAVRHATRLVVRRSAAVVAVSDWLRRRLVDVVPDAAAKTHVVDCGVDLERFAGIDPAAARSEIGWNPDGTAFLCLGSLTERKNVLRLASAFAERGEGSLAFVGDGPLRRELEGRPGIALAGPVPHDRAARWVAACDVLCQPSLVEPFGIATLEGLAAGKSVVATTVGGPPEFVPAGAGVLVDPTDERAIAAGLETAATLPRPNNAAVAVARAHDVRVQAERIEALLEQAATSR
jgi:glycosyltransferase involved in cell wall biosynthesis